MKFEKYSTSMLTEYITSARAWRMPVIRAPLHRADIVDIADFIGDSYKLAVDVNRTDAEFAVSAESGSWPTGLRSSRRKTSTCLSRYRRQAVHGRHDHSRRGGTAVRR